MRDTTICADLPDEVHRALKVEATATGRPVEVLAREIIIEAYESHVSPESIAQAHRGGGVDGG